MNIEAIRTARIKLHKLESALASAEKNGSHFSKTEENRQTLNRVKWLAERLAAEVGNIRVTEERARG